MSSSSMLARHYSWGIIALPAYRLYRLDGAGKFTSADWIEAETDAEAVSEVRRRVDGSRFELWDRQRLVERYHPEDGCP